MSTKLGAILASVKSLVPVSAKSLVPVAKVVLPVAGVSAGSGVIISENRSKNDALASLVAQKERNKFLSQKVQVSNEWVEEQKKQNHETLNRWYDAFYKQRVWETGHDGTPKGKIKHLKEVCEKLQMKCNYSFVKTKAKKIVSKPVIRSRKQVTPEKRR